MSAEGKRGLVVAVTGGRDFENARDLHCALDALHVKEGPIVAVVQGGGSGADGAAAAWASWREGVQRVTCDAHWQRDGRAAGPIRNKRMLELLRPDVLLACPGGAGTANCVETAKRLGIRIVTLAEVLNAPL
jgi:hypothetical protein